MTFDEAIQRPLGSVAWECDPNPEGLFTCLKLFYVNTRSKDRLIVYLSVRAEHSRALQEKGARDIYGQNIKRRWREGSMRWVVDAELLYSDQSRYVPTQEQAWWHHERTFLAEQREEALAYAERIQRYMDARTPHELRQEPGHGPLNMRKFRGNASRPPVPCAGPGWPDDDEIPQCICCCDEHTFEHCPARPYDACRGSGTMTYAEEREWAQHYGKHHGMSEEAFRSSDIAVAHMPKKKNPGRPGRAARSNPDVEAAPPSDFDDAVNGFKRFQKFDPRKVGAFSGLVIPKTMTCVGEGVHVLYRSDKWGEGVHDYIHEHEGGVYACRADREAPGFSVDVPVVAQKVTSLYLLGQCLGFRYVTEENEIVDAKVKRPLPELYSTPSGKVLFVIDVHGPRAKVVASLWGGKLDVRPEGIVG